jgi:hypothetical protein
MKDIHEGIKRLLDNTGYFSREEWAGYLDVDVQTLGKWCDGTALPTPIQLSAIIRELDAVKCSKHVSPGIPQLIEIVRAQSYPATPYTSVGYAILQPRMRRLPELLACLPYSVAEEVIEEWLTILRRRKQETTKNTPSPVKYPPLALVEGEESREE